MKLGSYLLFSMFFLGEAYLLENNDLNIGLNYLNKAYEINPNNPRLILAMAKIFEKNGDLIKAIEYT